MNMRKLFIFVFMILLSGTLFAGDVYVSDMVVPKTVIEGTTFNINTTIANTYDTNKDVNLHVELFSPQAHQLWDYNLNNQRIPAHDFNTLTIDVNTTTTTVSTAPYLIRITIAAVGDETNNINNVDQRWFVINQPTKKIPIPDMPIYFGFGIALIVTAFLINKKDKK